MKVAQHDIVIVGAGPAGLALAAELHRLGASPFVLDRLAAGANTSRAAVVHARTLEVLEPLGVVPEMIENGVIVPIFRVRDRSRVLASVSFKELDTKYPFTLMYPQNRTEATLLRRLESLGGRVQRPCEMVAVKPAADGVEVQYKNGESLETVWARWLVGCDGAHSIVREQAGIPFTGAAYEESFIESDVEMDWPLERDEVSLFFSEKGFLLVAPLPDDHFRIVATVRQAEATPPAAEFQRILEERGLEKEAMRIRRMIWSSRFHVSHRVAQTLRSGRVLLAGDAGHVHSPAGGQGMNTGIQDAISLAGVVRAVLQDGDESRLDAWQEKRLEIARSVVRLTDRMTKTATTSSMAVKLFRNAAVELIGHIPFAQHAMAEKLSELDNR